MQVYTYGVQFKYHKPSGYHNDRTGKMYERHNCNYEYINKSLCKFFFYQFKFTRITDIQPRSNFFPTINKNNVRLVHFIK